MKPITQLCAAWTTPAMIAMTGFGCDEVEGGVGYADTDDDDSALIFVTAGMLFNVGRD